jgi:hypothetical protein
MIGGSLRERMKDTWFVLGEIGICDGYFERDITVEAVGVLVLS